MEGQEIPQPPQEKPNFYQTLGVTRDITPEGLRSTYRKLTKGLHPDINPDPQAQERFKAITEAYSTLSDAEKRREYDMEQGQQSAPNHARNNNQAADTNPTKSEQTSSLVEELMRQNEERRQRIVKEAAEFRKQAEERFREGLAGIKTPKGS